MEGKRTGGEGVDKGRGEEERRGEKAEGGRRKGNGHPLLGSSLRPCHSESRIHCLRKTRQIWQAVASTNMDQFWYFSISSISTLSKMICIFNFPCTFTYTYFINGRPLSVSGRPCYILPMFLFIYLFIFYGRLILRPWLTEVRESFTRGEPWVSLEKLLLRFFPGHP